MKRYKHPRIPHLPWSKLVDVDDFFMKSDQLSELLKSEIVVTEKMDGENTTMYCGGLHARSIDSLDHPSRHYVKSVHASIRHLIPRNVRICGENLFAKHTIHYLNLESYFMVHSIWKDGTCFSWDQTKKIAEALGLIIVPEMWRGIPDGLQSLTYPNLIASPTFEGFVIRSTAERTFTINSHGHIDPVEYSGYIGKYVVRTFKEKMSNIHWMSSPVIPNQLKEK